MEEVNNILNPPENKEWSENDNFAQKTFSKGEGIVKEVIEGAKETVNLAVDEAKTIAPDMVDVFEESSERLNEKPRIVSALPNNVLVLGLLGFSVYFIIKKVL